MGTSKTVMIGRLTKDVLLNYGEYASANFNVAVPRSYKNTDGTRDADFFRMVAYRKTAELIATYAKKGSRVCLVCRPTSRKYTKEGVTHNVVEFLVEDFEMLDSTAQNKNSQAPVAPSVSQAVSTPTKEPLSLDDMSLFAGQTTQLNPHMVPDEIEDDYQW
ncbi:single-stranded DNA-binding protein [Lactococcus allomyrinae]|uniref:Single-stranded DNA-binding protein n=1 Tax=Lactococcus allomyrinae TaxID=2419773 RepID=A0A387BJB3_9LACT|nr:single-stranded DNA-binding protein [Lactococcus allomyrinae]AYG01137.1 single-stranded DNA-binding protein [Lactococcus allomyrinae]